MISRVRGGIKELVRQAVGYGVALALAGAVLMFLFLVLWVRVSYRLQEERDREDSPDFR